MFTRFNRLFTASMRPQLSSHGKCHLAKAKVHNLSSKKASTFTKSLPSCLILPYPRVHASYTSFSPKFPLFRPIRTNSTNSTNSTTQPTPTAQPIAAQPDTPPADPYWAKIRSRMVKVVILGLFVNSALKSYILYQNHDLFYIDSFNNLSTTPSDIAAGALFSKYQYFPITPFEMIWTTLDPNGTKYVPKTAYKLGLRGYDITKYTQPLNLPLFHHNGYNLTKSVQDVQKYCFVTLAIISHHLAYLDSIFRDSELDWDATALLNDGSLRGDHQPKTSLAYLNKHFAIPKRLEQYRALLFEQFYPILINYSDVGYPQYRTEDHEYRQFQFGYQQTRYSILQSCRGLHEKLEFDATDSKHVTEEDKVDFLNKSVELLAKINTTRMLVEHIYTRFYNAQLLLNTVNDKDWCARYLHISDQDREEKNLLPMFDQHLNQPTTLNSPQDILSSLISTEIIKNFPQMGQDLTILRDNVQQLIEVMKKRGFSPPTPQTEIPTDPNTQLNEPIQNTNSSQFKIPLNTPLHSYLSSVQIDALYPSTDIQQSIEKIVTDLGLIWPPYHPSMILNNGLNQAQVKELNHDLFHEYNSQLKLLEAMSDIMDDVDNSDNRSEGSNQGGNGLEIDAITTFGETDRMVANDAKKKSVKKSTKDKNSQVWTLELQPINKGYFDWIPCPPIKSIENASEKNKKSNPIQKYTQFPQPSQPKLATPNLLDLENFLTTSQSSNITSNIVYPVTNQAAEGPISLHRMLSDQTDTISYQNLLNPAALFNLHLPEISPASFHDQLDHEFEMVLPNGVVGSMLSTLGLSKEQRGLNLLNCVPISNNFWFLSKLKSYNAAMSGSDYHISDNTEYSLDLSNGANIGGGNTNGNEGDQRSQIEERKHVSNQANLHQNELIRSAKVDASAQNGFFGLGWFGL